MVSDFEKQLKEYEMLFGGTAVDKQLDALIQQKKDQGLSEADILNDLVGGRDFDEVFSASKEFDPSTLNIDAKVL